MLSILLHRKIVEFSFIYDCRETQGHTINTPPLQTSVGIDIAQKADYGVIEMSPFGGIEKYDSFVFPIF